LRFFHFLTSQEFRRQIRDAGHLNGRSTWLRDSSTGTWSFWSFWYLVRVRMTYDTSELFVRIRNVSYYNLVLWIRPSSVLNHCCAHYPVLMKVVTNNLELTSFQLNSLHTVLVSPSLAHGVLPWGLSLAYQRALIW
jgi:hypothetical protein